VVRRSSVRAGAERRGRPARIARRLTAGLLAVALAVFIGGDSVAAGPIKHWGTFPGRDVRAIAFRGDAIGANRVLEAVQGRDGFIYLRGRWGTYRVLDAEGRWQQVGLGNVCAGGGIDTSTWVPSLVCTRGNEIVRASVTGSTRLRVSRLSSIPVAELSAAIPVSSGGWWFAYGDASALGFRSPTGRSIIRRFPALGPIADLAATGSDLYALLARCRLARFHALALIDLVDLPCSQGGSLLPPWLIQSSGSVWVLMGSSVQRIDTGNVRRTWSLPIRPLDVAVDREGRGYVLGVTSDARRHPALTTIEADGRTETSLLPMHDVAGIMIDARDRIWIGVPDWHAFAVIAPKGTWD
jgi:hypothetical protein